MTEVLYLLLPLSLLFVLAIGGFLWWAIFSGQYDNPEVDGAAILRDDDRPQGEGPRPAVRRAEIVKKNEKIA